MKRQVKKPKKFVNVECHDICRILIDLCGVQTVCEIKKFNVQSKDFD
jgi:hypothetical protein